MTISNPQYPHTLSVIRQTQTGTNAMPAWTDVTVISGICRFYPDNGGSEKGGVKIADYKVSLPSFSARVKIGDSITCTDAFGSVSGLIKLAHAGNLGANIWFNIVSN
jgi:hypothetical protein